MKKMYLVIAAFLFTAVTFAQGVTTSSIGGQVTDANGEPLLGANVVAVHVASNTTYGATTDFDGYYRISGMRAGGPYKITISYVGFEDFVRENVNLGLGQTTRFSPKLAESATALDEVVVTGVSQGGVFDSSKTGSSTTVSKRQIEALPTVSRGIADFVRLTPSVQITNDNQISIAGQNNRYNAIYIDGAVNNDMFGLAASGTNGGQTGVNPFSVDAIESFHVNVAPFDVKISGFAGGAISAITRSGTNNIEGSVYGFYRNQDLAGKTPVKLNDTDREKLADFTAKTYGVRVGGPIIKDKLFYFVNYERQDDETPRPFQFSRYLGDTDQAGIESLRQHLISTYGYEPGGFLNNTSSLKSDKLIAKIDWNINDNHKLSLKHSYVKSEQINASASSSSTIRFYNTAIFFPSTTNSTSLELNSRFGSNISNNLIVGYTAVNDDRDPFGDPFPHVNIEDGDGRIRFGSEQYSTANLLEQDVLTITDNLEIYKGRHKITIGTHNEFSSSKNLFFANNFGYYEYDSLNDFLTNQAPSNYQRGYSLIADGAGNSSSGAAEFKVAQYGLYFQDEVDVSDNFKLSAGLRFDMPVWEDGADNEDFNTRTVALMEAAGKDLQGARVGRRVSTKVHVSPRVGFNWNVKGEYKTQVRGGFGVFTSRLPMVWPGGTYNNNGVTGGYYWTRNGVTTFNPDVNNQPVDAVPGSGETGGDIDLFAPGFKLPQVFKVNLAVDQKLPWWGLIASADLIYTDNLTAIYYENVNIKGSVGNLTGTGDNRPKWSSSSSNRVDSEYGRVILASNTGAGYSYNTSFTLRKPFDKGFSGSLTYSYGDSYNIFEGTSSQNKSQWRNKISLAGKNSELQVARSQFAQGHRIAANLSYQMQWNDNLKTTLSVFYEGKSGNPFSYVYREGRDLLGDDSRDNALMYVPRNAADINLEEGANGLTAAQQWELLDAYISNDDYLSTRRGKYAERNAEFAPWSHVVDLKLLQDFSLKLGGKNHTFQASFDIFNFTNLINKEWGMRPFVGNFGKASILTTEGFEADGTTPIFSFNPSSTDRVISYDDAGLQSSRWQMQVGLRYIFN